MKITFSKVTIIVPCYNEVLYIEKVISKIKKSNVFGLKKQIIVVNDGSTDRTGAILKKIRGIKLINKKNNHGKGYAIRQGLKRASGDVIIIQDSDLEYDPIDYPVLLAPILDGYADVVFGSRFVGDKPHRVLFFWHMVGNRLLTLFSNMLTNLNLTDMETGYKVITRKAAKKLSLYENRFGFEPEFTAKIAKSKLRIYEVGISYKGRGYKEGKKINWKDGFWAIICSIRYNLFG